MLIVVSPFPHDLLPLNQATPCRNALIETGRCSCFNQTCDFCEESSCEGYFWTSPDTMINSNNIWTLGTTETPDHFLVPICQECFKAIEETGEIGENNSRPFGIFSFESYALVALTTRDVLQELFIQMILSGSLETIEFLGEVGPELLVLLPFAVRLCWEDMFAARTISWEGFLAPDIFVNESLARTAELLHSTIVSYPFLQERLEEFLSHHGYDFPEPILVLPETCLGA